MYACPPFVPGSGGVQERASDPPKLELWTGVYLHVGAVWEQQVLLTDESFL